jgi:hypothetical protein
MHTWHWPFHLHIFPKILLRLPLKKLFFGRCTHPAELYPTYTRICILDNPRTYMSCILDNPRLPPKIAKNIKLQGIRWSLWAIEGFPTILPIVAHPQTE